MLVRFEIYSVQRVKNLKYIYLVFGYKSQFKKEIEKKKIAEILWNKFLSSCFYVNFSMTQVVLNAPASVI